MHRLRSAVAALVGERLAPAAARLGRPLRRRLAAAADLAPALLTGAGVFLVVAGLFNYFAPSVEAEPTLVPFSTPVAYTLPPPSTPGPTSSATSGSGAIATRVAIPALGIDLPIIAPGPSELFPLCDTAEYLVMGKAYAYPGAPQATYLYAHARVGMFLPLLSNSNIDDGAAMVGMLVEVYTADAQRHVYQIGRVIRHVPNSTSFLQEAEAATSDQLWLQTSEGHADTSNKLQVVAEPVGVVAAANAADAHPASRAKVCPDAPVCTAAGQTGCRRG
jgi:hypothetical protein